MRDHRPISAADSSRLRGLDLTPLYQECLLHSDERKETYDCIARELCDYGLHWRGDAVHARAYRARTARISIYGMQYGDEVTITPDLYRNFMLVHVSLKKSVEIEADGSITHVPEGSVFFSAPQDHVRLRWEKNCEQLIVRIPLVLIDPQRRGSLRQSGALLPRALTGLFINQLNLALNISRQGSAMENYSDWLSHVDAGLARFAGLHLFDLDPPSGQANAAPVAGADWRERLESYIHAQMKAPITLDDLVAAVGLGRSQLSILCQDAFGCSPMVLVRRIRLEAVRRDLETRPDQNLTGLSRRYGFEHQSRFARYYRESFGELPRETRSKLKN